MPALARANESARTLTVENRPKAISRDLFGVFFEDLNYAADGGLYAELVQNRSFEYSAADNKAWNALTAWELVRRGGGSGSITIEKDGPIHPNNPHFVRLQVETVGEGVGLGNNGFDGIVVRAGEAYDVSLHARVVTGSVASVTVQIETPTGEVLCREKIEVNAKQWDRHTATLRPDRDANDGKLVILANGIVTLDLDMISLFPQKTFRKRANGLRADLAQTIADLKPRFVRFPGGCLAHGDGLDNMYRWKETIGPVETRKSQRNIWRYHQTLGLGYYEYFQFCEDIGAKPLPVVPAGVCCQNSGAHETGKWGQGQQGLPMEQMPAYIQEVLDLIEYANGPATSTWGAKRAAAGHPEPFHLQYLGIGNEDHITPVFKERFRMIYDAVKATHPEIALIGTVGPSHSGPDYDAGWAFARENGIEFVDEHYYVPPDWFWENLDYYDKYDRSSAMVYLGEYAAHEKDRRSTLRAALAEAAYMTAMERNGDIVRFASYAPLLSKRGHTQWTPDLIYFDNTSINRTLSYHVQQLFALNAGDVVFPMTIQGVNAGENVQVAASCVRDTSSGDVILKIVSRSEFPLTFHVDLKAIMNGHRPATRTVLSGDPNAENEFGKPPKLVPSTEPIQCEPVFQIEVSPHSLVVIRANTGRD